MQEYRFSNIKHRLIDIWLILKEYPEIECYATSALSVVEQHLSDTLKRLKKHMVEAEERKQGKIFIT